MKEMAVYSAIMSQFVQNSLHYFALQLKSEKLIKALIFHLPSNTPVEDICNKLVVLGFTIINVQSDDGRLLTAPWRQQNCYSSLFVIMLKCNEKSEEIFKL
jgi:hypothetical protein